MFLRQISPRMLLEVITFSLYRPLYIQKKPSFGEHSWFWKLIEDLGPRSEFSLPRVHEWLNQLQHQQQQQQQQT